MAASNPSETFQNPMDIARRAGNWFIAIAVVFILLGTLAIVAPLVVGLAVTVLVGWLLIVGGVTHEIGAFRSTGIGRAIWQVIVGILYVGAGLYFLTHPLIALGTLTLFLAVVLFAEGVMDVVAYFATRGAEGSGWLLVNAIVTVLLSAMIWRQWPSISIWAIGTLVGINLLFNGFSRLMLGAAARSFGHKATA